MTNAKHIIIDEDRTWKIPAPPADVAESLKTSEKRTKRTDIHRPAAIVPAEYAYVTSYHLATTVDGWPVKPFNIEMVIELQRSEKFAQTGGLGKCSVCGAVYIYGDVWKHEPTGAPALSVRRDGVMGSQAWRWMWVVSFRYVARHLHPDLILIDAICINQMLDIAATEIE